MLNSGDVFAGFTIERLLGEGGMGAVYLARHPRLGKQTALKLLKPELFADAAIRTRFEREADLAAALDHPGIVTVYDRGAEGDHLWMCMQYIDGADAGTVNSLTLPPEKAVQIIDGVADALDYAHGRGVLHRDVKPSNILLARAGAGRGERVFLTDFGLARLRAETVRLTQTGMFTATLAFASPEQMTGGEMDGRSDQYSLACALYWLLTGMAPFDSPNPADIIHGNLQLAPPPLAVKRRGLPPGLDAVLAKAMAKHPGHRYRTCLEFAEAAKQALTGTAPTQSYPPSPEPGGAYPGAALRYPAGPQAAPAAPEPGYPAGAVPPPGSPAAHPGAPATGMGQTAGPGVAAANVSGRPGEIEQTGARPAVTMTEPGTPPAPPGSAVEQTGGFAAVPGVEHTGGFARPAAPYPGYHPDRNPALPGRRRSRAPLIAVAILVPLIVLALVVVAAVVLLGGDDSAPDGASAAPETATLEREPTGAPGPAETAGEPDDRTRRLFPTLLPQGSRLDGFGYQDAVCSWYEPDDRIPVLDDVPVFEEALESRPWRSIWDCRQQSLSADRMDYTIVTYPTAADAREVVDSLPPNDPVPGGKSGEIFTAHFWDDPGDRGRFTANMVVGFGTGIESPRGNSLLFVRYWGATAREDVEQWWADAPL